jgi:DNA polymerase-3 subunit beta
VENEAKKTMKTLLPRHDFQEALQAVASLTGGRTTKPILSCVKLVAEKDTLHLSATDGEAALRLTIPALSVDEPGEAVVPVDRLLGIVRELGDIEISLETADPHCTIKGAGRNFRIFMMSVADFPPVGEFEGEADLILPGPDL